MTDVTDEVPEKIAADITKVLERTDWSLHKLTDDYTNKVGGYKYELIFKTGDGYPVIARWELIQMIHCCGICVSTSSIIYEQYRGKGLGNILNLLRIHLATELGYGCLMCTDIDENIPQRKILKNNGWKDVHNFVNPRTGHTVFISVIDLHKQQ